MEVVTRSPIDEQPSFDLGYGAEGLGVLPAEAVQSQAEVPLSEEQLAFDTVFTKLVGQIGEIEPDFTTGRQKYNRGGDACNMQQH